MSEKRIVKCVVAGYCNEGGADFYFCKVRATEEQIEACDHWNTAMDAAKADGYEGEFVVFDETDTPPWLMERFVWDSASVIDLPSDDVVENGSTSPTISLEPGDWAHVWALEPSLADPYCGEMWYRTLPEVLDVIREHAPKPGQAGPTVIKITRKRASYAKLCDVFETDVLVGFDKARRFTPGGVDVD